VHDESIPSAAIGTLAAFQLESTVNAPAPNNNHLHPMPFPVSDGSAVSISFKSAVPKMIKP
jgi:hypothetical protein